MKALDKHYLIALSQVKGLGEKRISHLIDYYRSVENIFEDSEVHILDVLKRRFKSLGVSPFSKNEILDKATKIMEDSHKRGIKIVGLFEAEYPFNLKQIDNPPYIIYAKGDLKHLRRNSIAIVGTRDAQESSKKYAFNLSASLSALNISVVSGMARGVDTAAHAGALSAMGNTVAVLGNGIDIVYPSENIRLYEKIVERGIVISEFAVGTRPERHNFPRRNRIISGLSYATVMVEAAVKSGALITVNYALEHGREVYIAPYDERLECFYGNHWLHKDGAQIAYGVEDILLNLDTMFSADSEYTKMRSRYFEGGILISDNNETNINKRNTKIREKTNDNIGNAALSTDSMQVNSSDNSLLITEEERIIYHSLLKNTRLHIDEIINMSNLDTQLISTLLMQLELRGIVRQTTGKYYTLEEQMNGN